MDITNNYHRHQYIYHCQNIYLQLLWISPITTIATNIFTIVKRYIYNYHQYIQIESEIKGTTLPIGIFSRSNKERQLVQRQKNTNKILLCTIIKLKNMWNFAHSCLNSFTFFCWKIKNTIDGGKRSFCVLTQSFCGKFKIICGFWNHFLDVWGH